MNLEELKINGTNSITITDSLEAPLLRFHMKMDENTVIPDSNMLVVSVKNSLEESNLSKEYYFSLTAPLAYANGISDEFVLEPIIKESEILLKAYVIRNVGVEAQTIEDVELQNFVLYENFNVISTNYTNAIIEVIYPKDCNIVKLFLNNALYYNKEKKNSLTLEDIYYNDCFTKYDDKVNAAFNKVTVKCFDSENQNFSMDCDGNLVVNSITTRQESENQGGGSGLTFDDIYPVGSVYISANNVNPSTLFGGTWEAFGTGRTLIGVDTAQPGFNTVLKTGGTQTHTHIVPTHRHTESGHTHTLNDNGFACFSMGNAQLNQREITTAAWAQNYKKEISSTANSFSYSRTYGTALGGTTAGKTATTYTDYSGDITSGAASHLPPYICVYMWRRTA